MDSDLGYLFSTSCLNNDLPSMQWLHEHSLYIKQSFNTDDCFNIACYNGYVNIIEWLCDTFLYTDSNIYYNGFTNACSTGKYAICKWLYNNGLIYNAIDNTNFYMACVSGNLKLCKWLKILDPNLSVDINITDIENYDSKFIEWLSELCPTIEYVKN
jgi:hypothetical protein